MGSLLSARGTHGLVADERLLAQQYEKKASTDDSEHRMTIMGGMRAGRGRRCHPEIVTLD